MSRFAVYSEDTNGNDRVWLDQLGLVEALRFSTTVHGDYAASWQMRLSARTDHRALQPGRRLGIPTGGSVWRGTLQSPQRADVWTFQAAGAAWLARTYDAVAPTTGNALKLDEVIDAAIARGLPWTRPAALPALTAGTQGSGAAKIDAALDLVCEAKNKIWNVSRDFQITAIDRPTNVAYLLAANDTAGGRQVIGFVTDTHVTYQDSNSWAPTTILRSSASRPYGRYEDPLDITNLGPIPAAQAQDRGDAFLAKRGARLQFTAPFTVAPGQLLNPGGAPVDLASVQSTDGVMRVLLTDPDSAAGELTFDAINVPIGETDYDVDSGLLAVTPLDLTRVAMDAVFV